MGGSKFSSTDEVPGGYLNALTFYYLGKRLQGMGIPLLPRVCELVIFIFFNSSIPVRAEIGAGGRCEHRGIGVVIHPEARIGRNIRIFSNVTIGGLGAGREGAPTIGNDVVLAAGSCVLGDVKLGDRVYVGANAVVIADVGEGRTAVGVPATSRLRPSGRDWR